MAPSNSRNTMTRPLSTRPVQRAGLETGAVSGVTGMAFSCRVVRNCPGLQRCRCVIPGRTRLAETDRDPIIFSKVATAGAYRGYVRQAWPACRRREPGYIAAMAVSSPDLKAFLVATPFFGGLSDV